MQKRLILFYLMVSCLIYVTGATVLSNGVDLFTGKASFNHGLLVLNGRGGMDIDLSLKYSSANAETSVWE